MSKEQYIAAITQLLEQCNEEKVLYYVQTFLEKMIESPL